MSASITILFALVLSSAPASNGVAATVASTCAPEAAALGRTAYDATFTVNSASDDDDGACRPARCTLRDAIKAANLVSGASLIIFGIGSGLQVIPVSTPLPAITSRVAIDGTFQPGYSGTPLIVVDGQNAVADGLVLTADSSTVKALVVCRFTGSGIVIGSNANAVAASYIGVDPSGTSARPNGQHGILINTGDANEIGGEAPGDGNVISGNGGDGIHILGGTNNLVHGNRIGTNAAGTAAIGNGGSGVAVENSPGGQVGCTISGARNVISGNAGAGVLLTGPATTGLLVGANFIGTNAARTGPLGNSCAGIRVSSGAHGNAIGGTSSDSPNRIAYNTGPGIVLDPAAGIANRIQRNSIFSNGGLGIDLGARTTRPSPRPFRTAATRRSPGA